MQRVPIGSHELRVDASGRGAPLLALHGLVDTLEIWDPVAAPLAARGRLLRFDQRGHGQSGAPPGRCARKDLADDAVAVLDAFGVGRAVWMGHSMGGVVAMTAALAHPGRVAGLVLIGTASRCSEKIAGWYEKIALAGEADGADGLARVIYGERTRRRVQGDASAIAAVTRALESLWQDPLTPALHRITCPVLLLVGEKDPMGARASEIIAKELVDAELEVVPDCGHWIQLEAPETLLRAYDRWVAKPTCGPIG